MPVGLDPILVDFRCVWCARAVVVGSFFFFSSRRRHTRSDRDWSSDVCSSDLIDLSIEMTGLKRQRLLKMPDRFVEFTLFIQHGAKVVMSFDLMGMKPHGFPQPLDRKSVV